jgi:iron complex transport system substrate-binding protein
MPHAIRHAAVACLGILVLGACADSDPISATGEYTVLAVDVPLPVRDRMTAVLPASVSSADGVGVTVSDVSRIVVLNEALAELVVSLGFTDAIVGRDATTTLASLSALPEVSSGHDVSAEAVLSLAPTLVLGDTRTGPPEALAQLRGARVATVLAPEVWTLEDVPFRVRLVAAALGVPAAGEALLGDMQRDIDDALDTVVGRGADARPRVAFLYVRGTASVYLLGGDGSGADAMTEAAGGIDVGSEGGLAAFTPLTSEAVAAAAPDVLLVTTRGLESVGGVDGLLGLPGVAETRAASRRAVVAVDDDLLLSFGPRTGAVIRRLAAAFAAAYR